MDPAAAKGFLETLANTEYRAPVPEGAHEAEYAVKTPLKPLIEELFATTKDGLPAFSIKIEVFYALSCTEDRGARILLDGQEETWLYDHFINDPVRSEIGDAVAAITDGRYRLLPQTYVAKNGKTYLSPGASNALHFEMAVPSPK